MNRCDRTRATVIVMLLIMAFPTLAAASERTDDLILRGNELFKSGRFAKAEEAYKAARAADATDTQAVLRLGEIALLSNRLDEAKQLLERARQLRPDDDKPKSLLAEVYYRRDEFQQAASLFRDVGRQAVADKLDSFKGTTPYQILGDTDITRVKFLQTDPLPIVSASINDGDEVYLLIDTGASELNLDPEFAKSIGAIQFGSESGTFAGGKKAAFQHARIDSIRLGDFTIKNVPVHLLSTRGLPFAVGGQRIEGIIGTVLFYHFISTLDYPNGRLVLRRPTSKALAELDRQAKDGSSHVMPFWMAGDHYMMAWGEVNSGGECLMMVDTGMAGGGFTCPESTLKAAGIELSGKSFEGVGGGGTAVRVTPFTVEQLTLGDAKQSNIMSFYGALPPSMEYKWGFRVGGLISHAFFRPYALTFDFKRMQLYLKPKQ